MRRGKEQAAHGVIQQVVDPHPLHQALGIFAHRAEVRRLTIVQTIRLKILGIAAQGIGRLFEYQSEPA